MPVDFPPNGCPFKTSLMFYIFKNATITLQIKLIKCSKTLKESIKHCHDFYCDQLSIYHLELSRILSIKNGKLKYETEFTDYRLKASNPLEIREKLSLFHLFNENIIGLLPKLNISNIKNIEATQLHIAFDTLMQLLNPELVSIRFHLSSIIEDSDDALHTILLNCPNLKTLAFPWQSNITNLDNCAKIKRETKLDDFYLYNISENIEPKIVANFTNNCLAEKSRLGLCFNFSLPENYCETVKGFIVSEDVVVDVRVYPR